jgi:hypothetical protein
MATIRRKTVDPSAAAFMKYAREQGIDLSWNNYERALPLDGFARLGLSAYDLISGPARISPFDRDNARTACGEDRDDLVYRTMMDLIGAEPYYTDDKAGAILAAAAAIAEKPSKAGDGETMLGLGVLDADYVNIVAEDVPFDRLAELEAAAEKAADIAKAAGAKGFKFSIIGTCCSRRAILGAYTDAEFAVLTGLVDGYVLGSRAPGLGRNVTPHFATAVVSDRAADAEILRKAAAAYGKREKVCPCDATVALKLHSLATLAEIADKYEKIAIFAGGANLRLTVGEAAVNAIRALTEQGVACFTFGCAAIAAAKAGLTEHVYASGAVFSDIAACAPIAEKVKVVCVPELSGGADVARALYLGERGFKVITATELPMEGSIALADALHERLAYCESKAYTACALDLAK